MNGLGDLVSQTSKDSFMDPKAYPAMLERGRALRRSKLGACSTPLNWGFNEKLSHNDTSNAVDLHHPSWSRWLGEVEIRLKFPAWRPRPSNSLPLSRVKPTRQLVSRQIAEALLLQSLKRTFSEQKPRVKQSPAMTRLTIGLNRVYEASMAVDKCRGRWSAMDVRSASR